nr:NADH dehydrogenase subunit 5 [Nephrurus amyae]
MQNLLFHTSMTATLLSLLIPALLPKMNFTKATKIACLISLTPTLIFFNSGLSSITTSLNWTFTHQDFQISFLFDFYSITFTPIAIFITSSILQFTSWYMMNEPVMQRFEKYILLFLITMLILITSNNMLQLFIGWEGMGIMSFMLIGWWHSRINANTAALQAVIYNRIGDIGFLCALAWLAITLNSWELQQIFSLHHTHTLPLMGMILAATGKSAQIGLHPWLPAAMEGPTPVSALLHSSTMVVAGILLMIRLSPTLQTNHTATTLCLYLGTITTTFTAICALTQNDIKKIIAFSTSSQLGLMMVTIGLNQPELAFLHITTHAFFKAMLFLCSGSLIHNLSNEQDIRKMGGMQKLLPITTSCMTIGSLALTGTPFLAGFYSKDTIIEATSTSYLNACALAMTIMATSLTAAYSLRIIFYTQMVSLRFHPLLKPNEKDPNQTQPLIQLALGSTIMGLLITSTTITKTQTMTMSTTMKLTTIFVSLVGLLYAVELALYTTKLHFTKHMTTYNFSASLGFFNTLTHRTQPTVTMFMGQVISAHLNDALWYESVGPKTIAKTNILLTSKLTYLHKGHIKTYLATFIITLSIPVVWTTLNYT